ncbi:MAG TPA: HAD hydrolase-like protein [Spirochaetota bacterium]|nr:HAD hydrolase-like protein [Spirochaetota bacterium]HPJ33764.1 HAD hydrolase-like protein [Spirochaetota bacterium]
MDGTILNCNSAGRASLIQATKEVFGTIGRMERIDFQGKTDPVILNESLHMMGFSEDDIRNKTSLLKQRYFDYLSENIYNYDVIVFPGIIQLLKELASMENVALGLLTGNFTESAKIKLSSHDLNRYFSFGAYGDDAPVRNLLPEVAKKRMDELFNTDIAYKDTFIIGDTIHDVRCARYAGAVSVAVGTGWGEPEALKKENPDHYFDDLENFNEFIKLLED